MWCCGGEGWFAAAAVSKVAVEVKWPSSWEPGGCGVQLMQRETDAGQEVVGDGGVGGVKLGARNKEREGRGLYFYPFVSETWESTLVGLSHPTCILEARPSDGSSQSHRSSRGLASHRAISRPHRGGHCQWAAKFLSRVVSGWGEGSNEPANRTSLKEPHCHRRIVVGGRHGIGGSDEQKHSAQGNFRVALWSAGTLGILGTLSGLLLGRSGCNH